LAAELTGDDECFLCVLNVYPPPDRERIIVMTVSVYMSVCLPESLSPTRCPIFTKFLAHATYAHAWTSTGSVAICYVLPV